MNRQWGRFAEVFFSRGCNEHSVALRAAALVKWQLETFLNENSQVTEKKMLFEHHHGKFRRHHQPRHDGCGNNIYLIWNEIPANLSFIVRTSLHLYVCAWSKIKIHCLSLILLSRRDFSPNTQQRVSFGYHWRQFFGIFVNGNWIHFHEIRG